jgi:hypothetical protein
MMVRRRFMMGSTVFAATVGVCILVAELVLRLAGIGYPVFGVVDPMTGSWHRPGTSGVYRLEGEAFVTINRHGMRDQEYPVEKPPGTYRIAVLGDSYAEALQVEAEAAFWSVMERDLADCAALGPRSVEVLNFGASGFGTAQELLTWRLRASAFEPDAVLLAFVHNDLRNNSEALEKDARRPYLVLIDGELVLDDSYLETPTFRTHDTALRRLRGRLIQHSRVVQLVFEARRVGLRRSTAARHDGKRGQMYDAPRDPSWAETWTTTDAILSQLGRELRAVDKPLLVVSLSDSAQIHPDPEQRDRFVEQNDLGELYYAESRIAELASRQGFHHLAMAPRLAAHAERTGECFHGFDNAVPCGGHWNERGHELGGIEMARAFCEMIE